LEVFAMSRRYRGHLALCGLLLAAASAVAAPAEAQSQGSGGMQGAAAEPYPNMPDIAPIGVRIGKYLDVP
jgi:hypothetical protein